MKKQIFISEVKPLSERKAVKEKLLKLSAIRKRQLDLFDELSKPVRDNRKMLQDVLKSNISINRYLSHSDKVNKYLEKLKLKLTNSQNNTEVKNND